MILLFVSRATACVYRALKARRATEVYQNQFFLASFVKISNVLQLICKFQLLAAMVTVTDTVTVCHSNICTTSTRVVPW